MEYRYSHLIDPSSYDNQGLCNGIHLRCHRNSDLTDYGAIRLLDDWQRFVGPIPESVGSFAGLLGPVYNCTAVAFPECLPERLEIISYIIQFVFMFDDLMDAANDDGAPALDDQAVMDVIKSFQTGKGSTNATGVSYILQGIFKDMMEIDQISTKATIKYLLRYWAFPRDRTDFESFEDYLNFRVVDTGSYVSIGLMKFGMNLTVPAEEMDECERLTRPVWLAAGLTNDIQSWEKERAHAAEKSDTNAVWVLMKQESLTEEKAKIRVLQLIKSKVTEFCETIQSLDGRKDLSPGSKCLVEVAQYMISGNLIWGMSCPRYHSGQTLNQLQIKRMKHGQPPLIISVNNQGSRVSI